MLQKIEDEERYCFVIRTLFQSPATKCDTFENKDRRNFTSVKLFSSHLWWKICATNARFKLPEPSTISFGVKYRLQSIFSACSKTKFALSTGSFASNVAGLQCSGASTLSK